MRLTNPLWYLAAIALSITAVMVGVSVAAGAWDEVKAARVTPITGPIDAGGKTLVVYSDQIEDDVRYPCTTTPASDPEADPRELETPAIDVTTDGDGRTWTLIAIESDGQDGSVVSCRRDDDKTDTNNYGYALVDGFAATGRGLAIAVGGFVLSAALAIWVAISRRRLRSADS